VPSWNAYRSALLSGRLLFVVQKVLQHARGLLCVTPAWFPASRICSSVAVSPLSVAKVRKNYVHP